MNTETNKTPGREELENGKLYAEIMNLISESQKMQAETKLYPIKYLTAVIIGTVVFLGAIVGLVKAFLP